MINRVNICKVLGLVLTTCHVHISYSYSCYHLHSYTPWQRLHMCVFSISGRRVRGQVAPRPPLLFTSWGQAAGRGGGQRWGGQDGGQASPGPHLTSGCSPLPSHEYFIICVIFWNSTDITGSLSNFFSWPLQVADSLWPWTLSLWVDKAGGWTYSCL